METVILVVHVALAIGVIALVLMQQGKGADAGAAFGSGASGSVFGSRGAGSFLTRMTTLFAVAFFCTSMALFVFAANHDTQGSGSVLDNLPEDESVETPATPQSQENLPDDLPTNN